MQAMERQMKQYDKRGNVILVNNLSDFKSVQKKLSHRIYNLLLLLKARRLPHLYGR